MRRTISKSLTARSPSTIVKDHSLVFKLPIRCLRSFSTTSERKVDGNSNSTSGWTNALPSQRATPRATAFPPRSPSVNPKARIEPTGDMGSLSYLLDLQQDGRTERNRGRAAYNPNQSSTGEHLWRSDRELERERLEMPHLFSVYATRHNTHINVCAWRPVNKKQKEGQQGKPSKEPKEDEKMGYDVLISVSAGNLGFRKSARKHYDSAFQTAAYVMARMQERGWNQDIKKLEVHLRGFGAGREAVTKALLGSEGRFLRGKIVKVADNTRLKFGGTRSKKPRRLG